MIKGNKLPAIPPDDYKGTVADWMVQLQMRGLWDGNPDNWYGDIMLDEEEYDDILETCEKDKIEYHIGIHID